MANVRRQYYSVQDVENIQHMTPNRALQSHHFNSSLGAAWSTTGSIHKLDLPSMNLAAIANIGVSPSIGSSAGNVQVLTLTKFTKRLTFSVYAVGGGGIDAVVVRFVTTDPNSVMPDYDGIYDGSAQVAAVQAGSIVTIDVPWFELQAVIGTTQIYAIVGGYGQTVKCSIMES